MNPRALWQKIAEYFQKLVPDWRIFFQKCIPYVLVVVFASATVLAVLGVQQSEQGYITIAGSKAEQEAQKQALAESQKELAQTLEETQKLLNQLNQLKNDTQDLLDEAVQEGTTASDTLEELKETIENLKNQQQQCWVLPMQYTMCTSSFGAREHPVNGEAKFHYGVDLAANRGTPIVASRSGTVKAAAYDADNEGYYVNIDHLDGYVSRYMHMDKYIVTQGQFVVAGQIIGYCGDTGIATGVHLHFGIYKDGEAVDPADYIDLK